MSKPKVIITRKWPSEVEAKLESLFDVQLNQDDHLMSADELREAMRSADALCPTVSDMRLTPDIIDVEGRRCKIFANFGVGFDNIDTDAAKRAGIVVTNTPGVLTDCTSDIAMLLLLMVARRGGEGERHLRSKAWKGWRPTHMMGTKVSGKKLGCVGFGRIAQAVAKKAHFGFGMEIAFYDPYPPPKEVINKFSATQYESIEDVMRSSDFVSLHCTGGGENTRLINAERLQMMQKTAFLINTARGDVVDEPALVKALQDGVIAGAALDVYTKEPMVSEALLDMENVVLLPHLGSASTETRNAMGMCSLSNLEAFFAGDAPPNRVA